ncbi:MAG: 3-oxocholest-4-en-26-oyl-CoA dehydrogenase alpha subunit [Frankiaceae bacterium]|jgi:alkylation response protein AidB-like acyl-CoA dehydrogenase|nr:3-oxocholest-4-en-26-oyl-CoA dehydrogenase alpha subunit [Frankiaceae bacterium]
MRFQETAEEQSLRRELRAYFATLVPADERRTLTAPGENEPTFRRVVRRLGQDGWLGIGWPTEYGGQARSAREQFIMFDEVQRAGVPFPFVTINTVGPTIMRFGTDEQKAAYLPRILAGELNVAIGYTEPSAGTDLASLRTSARLDGDEWVINGSKVFTSGANQADLIWLACRTDPDQPKHKGLSMIMVPTDTPGFRCTPIVTVGDIVTTTTYYDDVHVPADNLVGERGGGWRMITTQLNHERVGLAALGGPAWRLWGEVRNWARTAPAASGGTLADVAWVRADLADCFARLEAMKLLNWQMVEAIADDRLQPAEASSAKFYGTETHVHVYRKLLTILGAGGWLRPGSPGAALRGEVERMGRSAQINTFGGGINEIQREIVAAAGLGMQRRAR